MPALDLAGFFDKLSRGKVFPAILLLGREAYLRDLCRARIVDAIVSEGARDWGVTRFDADGTPIAEILGRAMTPALLAPQQVVFVRGIEAWEKLGEEKRDELLEELDAYLKNPPSFTMLVFEAESLDQRLKLAKKLSEHALVISVELLEEPAARLRDAGQLVAQMARELGVELDREAAEEMAEVASIDLASAKTELEKLAAYVGDKRRIRAADVEALVVAEQSYSVWELAEVLADRNPERALVFLDSLLRDGEQPAALIGALTWMCRKLLEAQELLGRMSHFQAVGRMGMRPQAAEAALRQAKRISRPQLIAGLAALYEADSRLKSSAPNPRAIMEFLVARFAP